jgi:hypothetical protein
MMMAQTIMFSVMLPMGMCVTLESFSMRAQVEP